MAKVITDDKHYKAIAAAIRNRSDISTDIKPEQMAGCVDDVAQHNYYLGETDGYENGKTDGIAEGMQTEHDNFWNTYLNYGNAGNYQYAFALGRFTDETYTPNHPIRCASDEKTSAQYMFIASGLTDTKVEIIVEKGVSANYAFATCYNMHTIRKITLMGDNIFTGAFRSCESLKNITIEGVISNAILFPDSPKLTKASITNIVSCLSSDASGKTLTLSKTAVNSAFETSTDAADGVDSTEWAELIATKTNWTISLV